MNQAVGVQEGSGAGYNRAARWASLTAAPTELSRPFGWTEAAAYEINRDGTVAGEGRNGSGYSRAMRWDSSGNPDDLATLNFLVSTIHSYAYGISPRGWAVGKSQTSTGGSYHAFATPWFRDIQSADNLSPFSPSEAHAINGVGQIVGSIVPPSVAEYASLWYVNANGTISSKNLGSLGGTSWPSRALAINNRGQVVGWSYKATGEVAAFIWMPGWTGMQEVRTFISVADKAAWPELNVAYGITDDGVVVGYGKGSGSSTTFGFAVKPKP